MFGEATFADITFASFFSDTGTVVFLPRKARTRVTNITASLKTGSKRLNNKSRTKVSVDEEIEVISYVISESKIHIGKNNLKEYKLRTYVEPRH